MIDVLSEGYTTVSITPKFGEAPDSTVVPTLSTISVLGLVLLIVLAVAIGWLLRQNRSINSLPPISFLLLMALP